MSEQVRQTILVAGTLIDEYQVVIGRYLQAWKAGEATDVHRADLERVYTGIWENLDVAAALTRSAGRATGRYGDLRARVGTGPAMKGATEKLIDTRDVGNRTEYTFQMKIEHNDQGLALARECAGVLREAWPELDWTPPPEPDMDLRPRGFFSRLFGKR